MAVFLRDQRFFLSTQNGEVWHFTASQNHRTAEVTKELGRSSCSNPLLMQGPRAGQPRTLFRQLLGISKDRDSKNSQSNLCWHSIILTVFSQVQRESLVFQFVTTDSCHGVHLRKNHTLLSLCPPFRYLHTFIRCSLVLSSPGGTVTVVWAFSHTREDPIPSSS